MQMCCTPCNDPSSPTFTKSPPWIMKPLMMRWNVQPLYPVGTVFFLRITMLLTW